MSTVFAVAVARVYAVETAMALGLWIVSEGVAEIAHWVQRNFLTSSLYKEFKISTFLIYKSWPLVLNFFNI